MDQIHTTQFRLGTRLSRNEIVVRQTFDKVSMGSDFPIVGIDVVAGLKDILNGDYEYYRLELSVKHDFNIAPLGTVILCYPGERYLTRFLIRC